MRSTTEGMEKLSPMVLGVVCSKSEQQMMNAIFTRSSQCGSRNCKAIDSTSVRYGLMTNGD